MQKQPLVTVLMPCYNAMPFLKEAIESVINQTYLNLEILCINDGSTDETGTFLEEYALRDSRIRVVHNEQNIKLIETLNKGINLANGEFIARMDADDISYPQRIERSVEYLLNNKDVDLVSVSWVNISEQGNFINQGIHRGVYAKSIYYSSFLYNPVGHPQITCKTELLKQNHYFEHEKSLHTEDYELWSRLLSKNFRFANVKDVLYAFRINSNSVSNKFTGVQNDNFIYQANFYLSNFLNKKIDVKLSKVLNNRLDNTISYCELVQGLVFLKEFTKAFLEKENVEDEKTFKNIKDIEYCQELDILIQANKILKEKGFKLKVKLLIHLIFLIGNRNRRMYFFNKIRK